MTETIFITVILSTVLLITMLATDKEEKVERNLILLLCVTVFGILFRPHLILLLPITLIYAAYLFLKKRIRPVVLMACVLVPAVLLSVNFLYNKLVNKEPVLLENYSGANLYIANNPKSSTSYYNSAKTRDLVEPYYFSLPEEGPSFGTKSEALKQKGISFMLSHPQITIGRTLEKANYLFIQGEDPENRRRRLLFKNLPYQYGSEPLAIYFYACVAGTALSLLAFKKSRKAILFILLLMVYFVLVTSTGLIMPRYIVPILPLYFAFIGGAAAALIQGIRRVVALRARVSNKLQIG